MTILASLLLLSGCGAKEDTFSLSAAEQEAYEESIDKVTEDFYWEYDHSSLSFGAAVVPEATEENERLFDASSACEYNLKGKAGQDAVLAQAALLHYNGDAAGTLQCWFVGGSLAGVAYSGGYDNGYYSLKGAQPVFWRMAAFGRMKAGQGCRPPSARAEGNFPQRGFTLSGQDAKGRRLAVSIRGGKAEVVTAYSNGLSRYRSFSYGRGLEATSAAFFKGG